VFVRVGKTQGILSLLLNLHIRRHFLYQRKLPVVKWIVEQGVTDPRSGERGLPFELIAQRSVCFSLLQHLRRVETLRMEKAEVDELHELTQRVCENVTAYVGAQLDGA
jgi:hypothetical protein